MGFGDQILAAGQAQVLFDRSPDAGPIMFVDVYGNRRWQPVWDHNPVILDIKTQYTGGPILHTGKGCIPYLKYPKVKSGWEFTNWRARDHRGRLYLTEEEFNGGINLLKRTGPFVLIEAAGRDRKNRNRCWPFPKWQELVVFLNDVLPWPLLQLDHDMADRLAGVGLVQHKDFRAACGVLAAARLYIGPEGGLAHAAAALGIPAVVLWGGCLPVEILGYPEHVNLVYDHPETPCGSIKPCAHCDAGWQALTPEHVVHAVQTALGQSAVPLAAGVQ